MIIQQLFVKFNRYFAAVLKFTPYSKSIMTSRYICYFSTIERTLISSCDNKRKIKNNTATDFIE